MLGVRNVSQTGRSFMILIFKDKGFFILKHNCWAITTSSLRWVSLKLLPGNQLIIKSFPLMIDRGNGDISTPYGCPQMQLIAQDIRLRVNFLTLEGDVW